MSGPRQSSPSTGITHLAGMVVSSLPERAGGSRPAAAQGGLSGQEWDDFAIGELLGAGGMGEVYRARQRSIDRVVALKVMPPAVAGDPLLERRAANEARAAAAVASPHVVAVYAYGRHQDRLYIAMECIEGGTLADALAGRRAAGTPVPPLEAIDLVLQAAHGLAAAHARGLVHRDIKPGNLMLAAGGLVKVADFGLVKFVDEAALTQAGGTVGTPLYMSPEQGRGDALDARSDLYSLGAVLYELLTLRPPFTADSADGLVFQHNYAEPELPSALNPDVPHDLEAVVVKCLQKDPVRRFPDAAALIADLERLRAGLAPLSALFGPGRLGTGAEEALRRLAGRRRRWPWLAALAVVAALAAGWWWWDARKGAVDAVRRRLEPLARAAPAPATAAADLALLARLAGGDDPQVAQGRTRLAELEALRASLDALAAGPDGHARLGRAAALAERLDELTGGGDPALPQWRQRLGAAAAAEAALRRDLAPLDRAEPVTAGMRAEAAPRLARLAALAAEDDGDLRRWRALVAASQAEETALRGRLARLDAAEPLGVAELAALRIAHERLAAIAPGDPRLPAWERRLQGEAAQIAALEAALHRLMGQEGELGVAAQGELERVLAQLAGRGALGAEADATARARLAAGQRALAGLRGRLAALDAPRSLPGGLAEDLARYEALAGFADPRAQAWRTRYQRIRTLQARLEPLARPATPPPTAAEDLQALGALVGIDDPGVAAGTARLRAIAAQRERLAGALDAAAAIPPWAAAACAEHERLVGPDDHDLRRWRAKLAAWDAAVPPLAALAGRWVLGPEDLAAAQAALASAGALVGDGDPRVVAWGRRLAELQGPAAPAWAAAGGRDRHGPWCDLAFGGAVQRLRWLPAGAVALGSPDDEPGHQADEALARVRLSAGRWIADSECGQELWRAVMGGDPAAAADPRLPVEQVSRADAEAFCRRLAERLPGCHPRLPSEAEWEAAVRAGDPGPWGGLPANQAAGAIVHQAGGRLGPEPVGGRAANAIGLHDGLGNVWEWVAGGYGPHPAGADEALDPLPAPTRLGVARGGSWADPLAACRAANRVAIDPAARSPQLGFRFAVEAE